MASSRQVIRTANALVRPAATASRAVAMARPSAGTTVRFASSENGGYNEPTGYLFGEKPPPAGQKREKADWENIWYIGMFGSMALGAILTIYKPDTSLDTWAAEQAKKRLDEREGDEWKYKPSKYSGWYKGEGNQSGDQEKLV